MSITNSSAAAHSNYAVTTTMALNHTIVMTGRVALTGAGFGCLCCEDIDLIGGSSNPLIGWLTAIVVGAVYGAIVGFNRSRHRTLASPPIDSSQHRFSPQLWAFLGCCILGEGAGVGYLSWDFNAARLYSITMLFVGSFFLVTAAVVVYRRRQGHRNPSPASPFLSDSSSDNL